MGQHPSASNSGQPLVPCWRGEGGGLCGQGCWEGPIGDMPPTTAIAPTLKGKPRLRKGS